MIEYVRDDLLAARSEALVNAVNCVGAMGRGIALAFKRRFPDNYKGVQGCLRLRRTAAGPDVRVRDGRDDAAPHHQLPDQAALAWTGAASWI